MSSRIPTDPSLDDSNFPLLRKVVKPIAGKYTKWRAGEIVRAVKSGRTFAIRKLKMRGTRVPLMQSCCGIPAHCLMSATSANLRESVKSADTSS